jgi:hypothetical protein
MLTWRGSSVVSPRSPRAASNGSFTLHDVFGKLVDSELTPRDEELKRRVADLEHRFEQNTAVDQQVQEIAMRQQAQRDKGKNGIT